MNHIAPDQLGNKVLGVAKPSTPSRSYVWQASSHNAMSLWPPLIENLRD
jgi:hypothetical protein